MLRSAPQQGRLFKMCSDALRSKAMLKPIVHQNYAEMRSSRSWRRLGCASQAACASLRKLGCMSCAIIAQAKLSNAKLRAYGYGCATSNKVVSKEP